MIQILQVMSVTVMTMLMKSPLLKICVSARTGYYSVKISQTLTQMRNSRTFFPSNQADMYSETVPRWRTI